MASSTLLLKNQALGYLKNDNTIEDEAEHSLENEKVNLYWDTCVGYVQRDHLWGFAKKQVTLALSGTAPDGWEYQYVYPTDCVRADRIYNSLDPQNIKLPKIPFEVAANSGVTGKVIWTDQAVAQLVYGVLVTEPTLWTDDFDDALGLYLGHKLALAISNDARRSADLLTLYRDSINRAQTNNVREGAKNIELETSWIGDRA
jgi:hypothetical protein